MLRHFGSRPFHPRRCDWVWCLPHPQWWLIRWEGPLRRERGNSGNNGWSGAVPSGARRKTAPSSFSLSLTRRTSCSHTINTGQHRGGVRVVQRIGARPCTTFVDPEFQRLRTQVMLRLYWTGHRGACHWPDRRYASTLDFEEIVEVRFWTNVTADRRAISSGTASSFETCDILLRRCDYHAEGDLRVFRQPSDLYGHQKCHAVSVLRQGSAFQASSVEKYVLLCTMEQMVDVTPFPDYVRRSGGRPDLSQVVSLTNATADRWAFVEVLVPRTMVVTDAFEPVCVGQGLACRLTSRRVVERSVARGWKVLFRLRRLVLDGLCMTPMETAEMFTPDGLYVSGDDCVTHVTGKYTANYFDDTCAWQNLAQRQEEVSRLEYDSNVDSMTPMTGRTLPITSVTNLTFRSKLSTFPYHWWWKTLWDTSRSFPGASRSVSSDGSSECECLKFERECRNDGFDVPVAKVVKEIVQIIQFAPQKRVSERIDPARPWRLSAVCRREGGFTPHGQYVSSWDGVASTKGEYTTNDSYFTGSRRPRTQVMEEIEERIQINS